MRVRLTDYDKVRVDDALAEKLIDLDRPAVTDVFPLPADAVPGSVLFELQLYPYENALRHVATHLLMQELSQAAVWDALREGRAYVAFDWIADATGFDVCLRGNSRRHEMGSQVVWSEGLKLVGQTPLAGRWRLIRDGQLQSEVSGETFEYEIAQPGRYRVEVWLDVAGEAYPWILSNPFYVAAPSN